MNAGKCALLKALSSPLSADKMNLNLTALENVRWYSGLRVWTYYERVRRSCKSGAVNVWKKIETEEATKTALVMPFISQVLGYNVFDPSEVVPELYGRCRNKKGRKGRLRYYFRTISPSYSSNARRYGTALDKDHASQLYRYFSVTQARGSAF